MEYSMDILNNHLAWLEERKHRLLDRGSCIKDVSEKILDLINTLNYLSKKKDDTMTMNKTKLIKEVELIWGEMGAQCDEGYSISGHTLNKIVSRAYDNASEKSSDISPNSIAQFAERTVCPNCTSEDIYKRPDNMTRCNDCKCYWHTGL